MIRRSLIVYICIHFNLVLNLQGPFSSKRLRFRSFKASILLKRVSQVTVISVIGKCSSYDLSRGQSSSQFVLYIVHVVSCKVSLEMCFAIDAIYHTFLCS